MRYWRSKARSALLFIWAMASVPHKVFRNVRNTHCLSGLISSNQGLLPTSVGVFGFPFMSFTGWVFFGISKAIICLYLQKRFLEFFANWLKLRHAGAFLQGNLLVLPGELSQIFLSRVMKGLGCACCSGL